MSPPFSMGIGQIGEELSTMQDPGLYWININRQADAILLCQQLLAAQNNQQHVTLICSGLTPDELLTDFLPDTLNKLPLYTLPTSKAALLHLHDDIVRAFNPLTHLIVLIVPAKIWRTFSQQQLLSWVTKSADWLANNQCTLALLAYGTGANSLKEPLIHAQRQLNGLADLQGQQESAQYLIHWWHTQNGISANQLIPLHAGPTGWQSSKVLTKLPLFDNDEHRYLAERSTLEGAPAFSDNWALFDDNQQLTQHAMQHQAATIIFALNENSQIASLAKQIHQLRKRRGNYLKIVVREMYDNLKNNEEYLLLCCGCNLIVPYSSELSRFITMLESLQGQVFQRQLPEDIDLLLANMQHPLPFKGYLWPADFCNALLSLLENTMLPENDKGVLVCLRPTSNLRVEQAITLCHPHHCGDIMTIMQECLFLFLASCRINELTTRLQQLFHLPLNDIFRDHIAWCQDRDIAREIEKLLLGQKQKVTAQPLPPPQHKQSSQPLEPQQPRERRIPSAFTLINGTTRNNHVRSQ